MSCTWANETKKNTTEKNSRGEGGLHLNEIRWALGNFYRVLNGVKKGGVSRHRWKNRLKSETGDQDLYEGKISGLILPNLLFWGVMKTQ